MVYVTDHSQKPSNLQKGKENIFLIKAKLRIQNFTQKFSVQFSPCLIHLAVT